MKGVAKQVNGLRDDNGNRTARFYEMQDAIKAASEQLPMENGAVDFAALVEGGARMNVANPDDSWEDQNVTCWPSPVRQQRRQQPLSCQRMNCQKVWGKSPSSTKSPPAILNSSVMR